MATTIELNLKIDGDQFRDLSHSQDPERVRKMASAIEPELEAFDVYLEKNKMDPMGRIERQILREYIGWKLTGGGNG